MEKTTVITKLDFRTLKYCNLFIMKYKRKTGLWFLITAILALAVIGYDVYLGIFKETNYMFAILGGVFILYSGYQYFNLEKRLDTQLAKFFYNKRVTEQKIEITEEKIIVTRSNDLKNPVEFDWSYVTEILELPQYYMLMVGKGAPIIIDRSSEALIDGTKENIDSIIKEKVTMKPYKRTDLDIVKIPITYVHPEFPEVMEEVKVDNLGIESEAQEAKTEESIEEKKESE